MSPADSTQLQYAKIIKSLTLISITAATLFFILYIFSIIPSLLPKEQISRQWTTGAKELLSAMNIKSGWNWAGKLYYSDVLCLAGFAMLGFSTIISIFFTAFLFLKKREFIQFFLAVILTLVLVFAASGIIHIGH